MCAMKANVILDASLRIRKSVEVVLQKLVSVPKMDCSSGP